MSSSQNTNAEATSATGNRREAQKPGSGTEAVVQATTGDVTNSLGSGRRRVSDGAASPLVQDTFNLGIAFRILLIVAAGLVLYVGLIAFSPGNTNRLSRFANDLTEASLTVGLVLFGSMIVFGLLRELINGMSRQMQWIWVLGVPAVLAGLVTVLTSQIYGSGQSWGFGHILVRMLVAMATSAGIVEYLNLRARAFSPSLSEARLQALQARIRPHFLFNSLNTVLGLMRSEPRVAENTLENLSELFRVFMKDTRELIPLQDEIETCRQYLEIEQIRLGNRLRIDWQIEGGPADALVPSLLLQPLVENAVHHGIEPSAQSGVVAVYVARQGEKVEIRVVNPLLTEAPTRLGNQMALGNVKERLMLLYDMEAELKTETANELFCLTLTFPYRKERRRRDVRSYLNNPDR